MRVEACVVLPDGAMGPDPWDEAYGATLPRDHIICRDEKGIPYYVREYVWPWTAYHPHKMRSLLHFYYWKTRNDRSPVEQEIISAEREKRMRELQFLMVLAIYFNTGRRENGFGTLSGKLKNLFLVARFAEAHACAVRDILQQAALLDVFILTLRGQQAVVWLGWLTFLGSLDPEQQLGFNLASPKQFQELHQRAEEHWNNSKQHAPLPTRIYAALINNLRAELNDIETYADSLLLAINEARRLYPMAKSAYRNATSDIGPELVVQHGLSQFFGPRQFEFGLKGLSAAVNEVFLVCKLVIHVFSGMRSQEARTLPFHCMFTERAAHGRTHCLIGGITTKLAGSRKLRTKWVTTENEGFRAIRLAQRFAGVIYDGLGITPSDTDQSIDATPLFPSAAYLPWLINRHQLGSVQITPAVLHLNRARAPLFERLLPTIEEADISELEEIDPFRSWREEPEFIIGKRWTLATHQLRRSLAIYANASGLVRLSTLRRQLQHLTREMSLYYGRGSTFCKNFVADDPDGYKKHIAPEWQDGNEEAKMLAFTMDVLNSKEPLFGAAGNYFQRQRERGEVMSREDVAKQFKAGLLNYNEGPLGGCTKTGVCTTRKGLNLVDIACATDNCKHLIGKHSRIIQVIRLKHASLAQIDPSSIDYAMEKEEIESLKKVEAAWRPIETIQETHHV